MQPKPYHPTARDLPPSILRRVADGILNLLYPESCFICGAPVARLQDCAVCQRCWEQAQQLAIVPPLCPSCGIPLPGFEPGSDHLCGACIVRMPPYSGARSFGYYRSELSSLVQGLKFSGRRNLAGLLAPLLVCTFQQSWDVADVDVVIPVPLHPERKRERGFNQAALLAVDLARRISLPCCGDALRRIRPTAPQVGLSDAERLANVKGAFTCHQAERIAGRRVLLVDDVMTTGATAASAGRTLLDGGARRVSVLTLARTVY